MGFGHYTAYARDWKAETLSDNWYSYDDNDVEVCKDPNQVVSKAAYILMYRRRP
jgi:ubiquitin C-terminal hydrolase